MAKMVPEPSWGCQRLDLASAGLVKGFAMHLSIVLLDPRVSSNQLITPAAASTLTRTSLSPAFSSKAYVAFAFPSSSSARSSFDQIITASFAYSLAAFGDFALGRGLQRAAEPGLGH